MLEEEDRMLRKIIHIDEKRCNGCGACAAACHENAIGMVDGKARLLREDYCDGLGDCLPACPAGAITIEEREAAPYDEAAVKANQASGPVAGQPTGRPAPHSGGCPGAAARGLRQSGASAGARPSAGAACPGRQNLSRLRQWPVQIKLAPVSAPYFQGARLLIAADCSAYACGSFHEDFLKGRIALIGCPKLDNADYSEKLAEILRQNDIRDIRVVRMEVPCCGGIEAAVKKALAASGKQIPWQVVTISLEGEIVE